MNIFKPLPRRGSIVRYDHPDWGPCWGRVMRLGPLAVLVQDLHLLGAREWWPLNKIHEEPRR
jgi:hypothetical protein